MVGLILPEPGSPAPPPPRLRPARRKTDLRPARPIEPLTVPVVAEPPRVAVAAEVRAATRAPAALPSPEAVASAEPVKAQPSETAPAPPAVEAPRFDAAYLQNPPPVYPPLARRLREEGKVLLRVLVNADGGAERVELRDSSGSTRLDGAALDTVKRWRFAPARQGERPVAAWVIVPISFSLEG